MSRPPLGAGAQVSAGELILAIDTGSPLVSVALGRGGHLLAARAVAVEHSSRQLLALIAEVLGEVGARPADLAGVVALRGPGAFTGLRIGLSTALGFHQALGIKALALPTLTTLAAWWSANCAGAGGMQGAAEDRALRQERTASTASVQPAPLPLEATLQDLSQAAGPPEVIIAAVDARRGEWSAQAFAPAPSPRALTEMVLAAGGELARVAPVHPSSPAGAQASGHIVVVGFGVSQLAPKMPSAPAADLGPAVSVRFVEPGPLAPTALRLAAAMPASAWQAAELTSPIYSRPPAITTPKPPRRLASAPATRKADGR